MRARLLVALAVLLAAGAAGCGGGSSVPDGISDLRVCTDRSLDAKGDVCTKDERGSALTAAKFNCSVRIGNRAGQTIDWRFLLDGQEVTSYTKTIPKGRGTMVVWVFSQPAVAKAPLPGGDWTCTATLADQHLSADFRSGGPTDRVQTLAACRTSTTVATQGGPRVCAHDESADPIPPAEVTCSAGLANAKGSGVELTVLQNGAAVLHEGPLTVPKPMNTIGAALRLQPGNYACVYALDGQTVATKRFTVG